MYGGRRTKGTKEQGITLLALVITIILLVILSAVVIRGLAGNGGLVETTLTAKEQHTIAVYKETIEQIAQKTIIGKNTKGEEATVTDIAKEIKKEEWVSTAEPNEENHDILVVSKEGYVFQVYYNNVYGRLEIDFTGKDPGDGAPYPTVTAEYEQSITSILAKARVETGEIAKVELIYRGEVRGTIENPKDKEDSNGKVRFKVEDIGIGIYKVRATTDKGKVRQTWVEVSNVDEKMIPPEIKADKEPNSAGWYSGEKSIEGSSKVPVTLTLEGDTSTGENAKTELRYRIVKGVAEITEKDDGYIITEEGISYKETGAFSLSETGLYTIYAWRTDGKFRSPYSTHILRIDTKAPTINDLEITGVNGKQAIIVNGKAWHSSEVEIGVSGDDETSNPIHYEYKLGGSWVSEQDMTKKIQVTDELETVVAVRTIDSAGNISEEKQETIRIDRKAPTLSSNQITIEQGNITNTAVRFTVYASDEGAGKEGGIRYIANVVSKDGSSKKTGENTTGEFEITGLNQYTEYNITAIAKDPIGVQETDTVVIQQHTSEQAVGGFRTRELKAPNVTAVAKNASDNGDNGWIRGTVVITVTDTEGNAGIATYANCTITNSTTGRDRHKRASSISRRKSNI